jgi:hypothetical protein
MEPMYDRRDQLDKIAEALISGERIEAVFDLKGGGTGFLGVTDRRLIIYDKAFLRRMKAVVSVPYSRVTAIAAQDDNSLFAGRGFFASSKVVLTTSHGEYEFEFRGADKAHVAHNLIVAHMV